MMSRTKTFMERPSPAGARCARIQLVRFFEARRMSDFWSDPNARSWRISTYRWPQGIVGSTLPPREVDERLKRGGRVAPAGIVETQGRQSGRPILKDAHKAPGLDVVSHVGLHRQGETD